MTNEFIFLDRRDDPSILSPKKYGLRMDLEAETPEEAFELYKKLDWVKQEDIDNKHKVINSKEL